MDKQPQSRAPLIIAIVLLLLLLYVGSYLVLVTPSGYTITTGYLGKIRWPKHYRVANRGVKRLSGPWSSLIARCDQVPGPIICSKYLLRNADEIPSRFAMTKQRR